MFTRLEAVLTASEPTPLPPAAAPASVAGSRWRWLRHAWWLLPFGSALLATLLIGYTAQLERLWVTVAATVAAAALVAGLPVLLPSIGRRLPVRWPWYLSAVWVV